MRPAAPARRPRRLSRRAAGLIRGTARRRDISTVTVTGAPAPEASVATTSAWTISPLPGSWPGSPLPRKGQP